MSGSSVALEVSHLVKRYESVRAVDDVSLQVRRGTVHALLGENGAGKTTLMRIVYGMIRADAGSIRVDGREVHFESPLDAIAAGIGMVHQHFTLVPAMTVRENLALGGRGRLRGADVDAHVQEVAARTGFALDPAARVETLPVGAQQRVEIAKALARDASFLVLDEPTAVLAPREIDDLLAWLRGYADAGHAAVLITHKLREALAVADDVTVLRHGRVVHAGSARALTATQLAGAMIGAGAPELRRASVTPTPEADALFAATSISVVDDDGRARVRNASFHVRGREIVGIAAVEGSGQRELLRALAGRYRITSGQLTRPEHVGFVPEDRHRDALLLDRPVLESVALRGAGARRGVMKWISVEERTTALMREFDVRAPDARVRMRTLSGGNQQKLVLARELAATHDAPSPQALIVENPTRGLDVRASAAVHRYLREAAARGAAVVFFSSDLDEVLLLASRVLAMFDGTVTEVPLDRDAIGRVMLGQR